MHEKYPKSHEKNGPKVRTGLQEIILCVFFLKPGIKGESAEITEIRDMFLDNGRDR